MTDAPLISVLMPVHRGRQPELGRAVDSILEQSLRDLELIVVDDGNDPDIRNYLRSLPERDERVRLIENPRNLGLTASLVLAASQARGTYLARQDADDVSLPMRLQSQAMLMAARPDMVMCGTWYAEQVGNTQLMRTPVSNDKELREALNRCNPFCHTSALFRREAYEAAGGYDPTKIVAQDIDLWLRLARQGTLGMVREPLVLRLVHEDSVTMRSGPLRQAATALAARWSHPSVPGIMGRLGSLWAFVYQASLALLPPRLRVGLSVCRARWRQSH